MMWAGILVACAACYGLKLAGLSLPASVLQDTRVQRTVPLVPVALAFTAASSKADQGLIQHVFAEHGRDNFVSGWLKAREIAWAIDLITQLPELESSK